MHLRLHAFVGATARHRQLPAALALTLMLALSASGLARAEDALPLTEFPDVDRIVRALSCIRALVSAPPFSPMEFGSCIGNLL
jgi:hypothetical protein